METFIQRYVFCVIDGQVHMLRVTTQSATYIVMSFGIVGYHQKKIEKHYP